MEKLPVISVVIPVYNERESLLPLHAEIVSVQHQNRLDLEVVFVDDGSSDGSWDVVADLARRYDSVRGIRFRRNFGKAAALSAGFPRFLAALQQGGPNGSSLDVVSGWKRVRHDPWHKVFPSRVFNRMVGWMTGVHLHDHNCGMKAYRAEVFREVSLYGELHRFIPVLAEARGFKVGEIEINHRPRRYGSSKYGMRRFIKGFLDLLTVKFLTGYGRRPQHLLGTFGLMSFLVGSLGMVYLALAWVARLWYPEHFEPLHQRPLLHYSLAALLLGAQMMSIGFLAELITAYQGKEEDSYSVVEQTPPPAKAATDGVTRTTPLPPTNHDAAS
jgi:glycosyltransferase involved in cell wall biosynthesis